MSTLAEIKAGLPRLTAAGLAEVERLARDAQTRATPPAPNPARPKVGETIDPQSHVPDTAFAPFTVEELKAWGL